MALRVCSFESRRGEEMKSLIERHGGEATVAPSMREVPLESNTEALAFAEKLLAGDIEWTVFLTGVGATALLDVVEPRIGREPFLVALRKTVVAVRGPKPAAVMKQWDVPIAIRAAEPNTWRELVTALCEFAPIAGKRIAVQEYGQPNEELYQQLCALGAKVIHVPVYRWELPADTGPLRAAVQATIAGRFEVLLFTSARQVLSVLEVANEQGQRDAWLQAAAKCVVASIGPTASETLREVGLPIDVEASPTKMGPLVRSALQAAPAILAAKR